MYDQDTISFKSEVDMLPKSLQTIASRLHNARELKPSQMVRIIKEADVQAEDLLPWADYDHPAADSYGRKMIFKNDHFEMMVMSWNPGDFSAIHDHGYTQWGAVQIFGPAEHATFRIDEEQISTLARWQVQPGDIIGVSHALVHQMGNPTKDLPFLSLHVYGNAKDLENVTANARLFDLQNNLIQRIDGGVFFALPDEEIKSVEAGPEGDFPTRLRHMTELIWRLIRMTKSGDENTMDDIESIVQDAFSTHHRQALLEHIERMMDKEDHQNNSVSWRILNLELRAASALQKELEGRQTTSDQFHKYAEVYNALIGNTCLEAFMADYIQFAADQYDLGFADRDIISLGCGTGLVEKHLIKTFGISHEKIYGIDISASMIAEARKHINADVGDILTLDPGIRLWDIAYSGLNVFQYLDAARFAEAIQKTAAIVKPGGFFLGDFITPDHIRWYPNVVYSEDRKVISLRTPGMIEEGGLIYQESAIVNINLMHDQMEINNAGVHRRFLPPLHRVRMYFENAFGGQVDLYDAHSLKLIPTTADSCPSTRYIVVARKEK